MAANLVIGVVPELYLHSISNAESVTPRGFFCRICDFFAIPTAPAQPHRDGMELRATTLANVFRELGSRLCTRVNLHSKENAVIRMSNYTKL